MDAGISGYLAKWQDPNWWLRYHFRWFLLCKIHCSLSPTCLLRNSRRWNKEQDLVELFENGYLDNSWYSSKTWSRERCRPSNFERSSRYLRQVPDREHHRMGHRLRSKCPQGYHHLRLRSTSLPSCLAILLVVRSSFLPMREEMINTRHLNSKMQTINLADKILTNWYHGVQPPSRPPSTPKHSKTLHQFRNKYLILQ